MTKQLITVWRVEVPLSIFVGKQIDDMPKLIREYVNAYQEGSYSDMIKNATHHHLDYDVPGYDGGYELYVVLEREETDEEERDREEKARKKKSAAKKAAAARKARQEAEERKLFEKLSKKYA